MPSKALPKNWKNQRNEMWGSDTLLEPWTI